MRHVEHGIMLEAEGKMKGKEENQRGFMAARNKAILCAHEAVNYKALDLVLLDVSGLSSFADFFIICSGKSSRQVQGIADHLEESLRGHGIRPLGVEGRPEGHWILLDFVDVIVHIFYEPVRAFYDLESLWSEAETVRWERASEGVHVDSAEEIL